MNQVLPRHLRSLPRVCDQRAMLVLSWYGTPMASRSSSTRPLFVRWKMYSWQSFRKRGELIGLKWPYERLSLNRSSDCGIVIDLIQWMVFCKTNKSRNAITISCGSIGFDGALPMFKKNEPSAFRMRRISAAHFRQHSK